jgi:hypothetical protein
VLVQPFAGAQPKRSERLAFLLTDGREPIFCNPTQGVIQLRFVVGRALV